MAKKIPPHNRNTRVRNKIYPKGSKKPTNVPHINAYEAHRAQNPIASELWRMAELDLSRKRKKRPVTRPKVTERILFKIRINENRANCIVYPKDSKIIFIIQHPTNNRAGASFHLDPKKVYQNQENAVEKNSTISQEFRKIYGDPIAALKQAWKQALVEYSGEKK